jgi:hypothetical protein
MDSNIERIIIVGVAAAAAAALWYAIRKHSRKIRDDEQGDFISDGATSQNSSFKKTAVPGAVLNLPSSLAIETEALAQTDLSENEPIRPAERVQASTSENENIETRTEIAAPCAQGPTTPGFDIDQTADAPQQVADTQSFAALNDPGEHMVTLQPVTAQEATSERVPMTVPDVAPSAASHGVGVHVGTEGCSPRAESKFLPEPPATGAAIIPTVMVQLGSRENDAQVETEGLSWEHVAQSEEHIVPGSVAAAEAIEVESTAKPTPAVTVDKVRQPPKYQPSIRVGDVRSARTRIREADESTTENARSFSVLLHIVSDRRNRYRLSLLPARNEALDETVNVAGPNGEESWSAPQDEWFSDIMPSNLGTLLEQGAVWRSVHGLAMQWVLSGREIYVLAQNATISAFVSTSRLSLYEDHLVLVSRPLEDAARKALTAAGCSNLTVVDDERGVPSGWVLFKNVRPTVAVLHESEAGILNILRPVHDVEIVFRGGIRLGHANWLQGHPPQIRLKGATDALEVLIDGQRATDEGDGNFQTLGWDEPGKHIVFCGGVTQSYALVDGLEQWEPFDAFVYRLAWSESAPPVAICGPLVVSHNSEETLLLSTSNTCLLGRVPGQIVISPAHYNVGSKEFLATADFPVVWALPAAPLQCNRSLSKIMLVSPHPPSPAPRSLTKIAQGRILRWCYAILESSYKRLDVDPANADAKTLWQEYKTEAHRLKRLLR